MTLLREFTDEPISVLVTHHAYSAGTLTALGADSIVMHPMGMLGPTDPMVTTPFNPEDPSNPARAGASPTARRWTSVACHSTARPAPHMATAMMPLASGAVPNP